MPLLEECEPAPSLTSTSCTKLAMACLGVRFDAVEGVEGVEGVDEADGDVAAAESVGADELSTGCVTTGGVPVGVCEGWVGGVGRARGAGGGTGRRGRTLARPEAERDELLKLHGRPPRLDW